MHPHMHAGTYMHTAGQMHAHLHIYMHTAIRAASQADMQAGVRAGGWIRQTGLPTTHTAIAFNRRTCTGMTYAHSDRL